MIIGAMTFVLTLLLLLKPTYLSLTQYAPTPEFGAEITVVHNNPVSTTAPFHAVIPDASPNELYLRVAARSLGEGSFALAEIACTIKNRLQVSGAPLAVVLRAYHAHDVAPNSAQVEIVRQIFAGERACPPTWWYALSLQDTHHWKPHPTPALVIRRNNRSQVWIFHR
jgi:hypothetical protein